MRVLFTTTQAGRVERNFDALEIDYVRRTVWQKSGHIPGFIVSKETFVEMLDWAGFVDYFGVDHTLWWEISSCNKQYITRMDGPLSRTYLGCITEVNGRAAEAYAQTDPMSHLIISSEPGHKGILWIPRLEGSPSRLIPTEIPEPNEAVVIPGLAEMAANMQGKFPVDPAAPKPRGGGMVERMQEETDTIAKATSAIVVQLNVIARARRNLADIAEEHDV